MRRLDHFSAAISLLSNASAPALPPSSWADVSTWTDSKIGCVPELELEVWTETAAVAVTNAVLYGARTQAHTFADITVTGVANAANEFTKNGHARLTGDGPLRLGGSGVMPGGSDQATDYWLIKTGTNTFKLAASLSDALSGTAVDLTTDGSGVIKLTATASTLRLHWSTHNGLLGLDEDGSFDLATGAQGYSKRIPHSPRVIAYALVATLDTGTVYASVRPIQDR